MSTTKSFMKLANWVLVLLFTASFTVMTIRSGDIAGIFLILLGLVIFVIPLFCTIVTLNEGYLYFFGVIFPISPKLGKIAKTYGLYSNGLIFVLMVIGIFMSVFTAQYYPLIAISFLGLIYGLNTFLIYSKRAIQLKSD